MNNDNQFNQVDLLFDPVRALAHVIRMRNITLTNKPDHEFVAYFNETESKANEWVNGGGFDISKMPMV